MTSPYSWTSRTSSTVCMGMRCFILSPTGSPAAEVCRVFVLWLAPLPEPLCSAAGVRQDPCGPCLFALTLQDLLQVDSLCHPEVYVKAYLQVRRCTTGAEGGCRQRIPRSCNQAEKVGLDMQPPKSTVYSSDASNVEEIGILLRFSVNSGALWSLVALSAGPASLHRRQSRLRIRW